MAVNENEAGGTAVATTETSAMAAIRQAGTNAVGEQKVMIQMNKMLEGIEWGSGNSMVRGSDFSPAARFAFAKFCVVTRANPQIHVDLLGGKPYLNAQYYRDKLSADPHFIDDVQVNISASVSAQLRKQARDAMAEARELGLPEPTSEVQGLLEEARTLDRLRAEYSVPEWAKVAIETRIRRYVENAPLDAIRRGEVPDPTAFERLVRECNWAGNKPQKSGKNGSYDADPIGNAEPEKTARTRSFRRCARNAFSAWFDQFDDDVSRANQVIEAEWTEIKETRVPTVANAISTGRGEPTAALSSGNTIPAQDVTSIADRQQRASQSEPIERTEPTPPAAVRQREPGEDDDDAGADDPLTPEELEQQRRGFFATLTAAGVKEDARHEWMAARGLPDSVSKFERRHFQQVKDELVTPVVEKLINAVGGLGFESIQEYCRAKNVAEPAGLKGYKKLLEQAENES